jgi:hypothetical protein
VKSSPVRLSNLVGPRDTRSAIVSKQQAASSRSDLPPTVSIRVSGVKFGMWREPSRLYSEGRRRGEGLANRKLIQPPLHTCFHLLSSSVCGHAFRHPCGGRGGHVSAEIRREVGAPISRPSFDHDSYRSGRPGEEASGEESVTLVANCVRRGPQLMVSDMKPLMVF